MGQSGLRKSKPGTKARTQAKGCRREDTEMAGKPDHEGVGGSRGRRQVRWRHGEDRVFEIDRTTRCTWAAVFHKSLRGLGPRQ